MLSFTLKTILKLLHPLIPFITSEIYTHFDADEQLGLASWPEVDENLLDPEAEQEFDHLREAVGAVRNLRSEANLSPSQSITIFADGPAASILYNNRDVFQDLTRSKLLEGKPEGMSLSQVVPDIEVVLPFAGLIDGREWRDRQEKRVAQLKKDQERSNKKLSNDKFIRNAPAEVVQEERRRLTETGELLAQIQASLLRVG